MTQYVSLWSSYRQSDDVDTERLLFWRNQKLLLPRSFLADFFLFFFTFFFSRVMCEIVAKKNGKKSKSVFFMWNIWLLLGFAVVVGGRDCVNLL